MILHRGEKRTLALNYLIVSLFLSPISGTETHHVTQQIHHPAYPENYSHLQKFYTQKPSFHTSTRQDKLFLRFWGNMLTHGLDSGELSNEKGEKWCDHDDIEIYPKQQYRK